MVNVKSVVDEWIKVIGYRQNYDPNGFQLLGDLIVNESNMYYDSGHALLTTENLIGIAPAFEKYTYPDWAIGTPYKIGNVTVYATVQYKSKTDNVGKQPDTSTDDWEVFNGFNQWLQDITRGSLTNALLEYLRENEIKEIGSNIFSNLAIYEGAASLKDLIDNDSTKLVGLELVLLKGKSVSIEIPKIAVQLSEDKTFNIKLYHSSTKAAIKTMEIAYTGSGSVQWFDISELLLTYDLKNPGGSYYLVYNQPDLGTAQALNNAKDWSADGCNCSRGSVRSFNLWSKAVKIHPFEALGDTSELWDIEGNRYNYATNYGINLVFSAYCDYTNFLIDQKATFKDFMLKRVTIDLLREIMYNPNAKIVRENQNVNLERLEYEIMGDPKGRKSGIQYEYERSLKALRMDTQGLDKACLKCARRGVRVKTI